jgi:hypothetical protein
MTKTLEFDKDDDLVDNEHCDDLADDEDRDELVDDEDLLFNNKEENNIEKIDTEFKLDSI